MLTLTTFQVGILYIFYNHSDIFRAILDILLKIVGIGTYTVSGEKTAVIRVLHNLQKKKLLITGKGYTRGKLYPSGFIVGQDCVGFIKTHPWVFEEFIITLVCTEKVFHEITDEHTAEFIVEDTDSEDGSMEEDIKQQAIVQPQIIEVYTRHGEYTDFYYHSHKMNVGSIQPKGDQEQTMNSILAYYKKYKRGTFFLEGPPATGKSSVGYLLAKELKAPFTHQLDPTLPGDSIYRWIQNMSHDNDQSTPSILVIEEADTMIQKIHTGNVLRNERIPTDVHDKTTWSNFLDDMVFYNNVILILTSNTPKKVIDEWDPAYLRKGRVSMVLEMNTSVLEDESTKSYPSPSVSSEQQSLEQPRVPSPTLPSVA
jgi:hypothetical protein